MIESCVPPVHEIFQTLNTLNLWLPIYPLHALSLNGEPNLELQQWVSKSFKLPECWEEKHLVFFLYQSVNKYFRDFVDLIIIDKRRKREYMPQNFANEVKILFHPENYWHPLHSTRGLIYIGARAPTEVKIVFDEVPPPKKVKCRYNTS